MSHKVVVFERYWVCGLLGSWSVEREMMLVSGPGSGPAGVLTEIVKGGHMRSLLPPTLAQVSVSGQRAGLHQLYKNIEESGLKVI